MDADILFQTARELKSRAEEAYGLARRSYVAAHESLRRALSSPNGDVVTATIVLLQAWNERHKAELAEQSATSEYNEAYRALVATL